MAFKIGIIMNNNTKKRPIKQSNQSYQQKIDSAQAAWLEEEKELTKQKTALGCADVSWNEFLKADPNDRLDSPARSEIIALQEQYTTLSEQQRTLWSESAVVEEFNKKHAVVHTGQTYILTEKVHILGGIDFSLEGRQSFRNFYEDETAQCADGKWLSKADIWLKSPHRRKYKDIIFDPTIVGPVNGYYNLWKGFNNREAKQGDCSKYWAHVQNNICSGDEKTYRYVRKWLAYIFQHPDEVHTALVLCGSQGVGKNSFVEPLGELLGSHYVLLSSISELVSNFNYHLKNAVLIHANEALWGGNRKEIGTIKAMITEKTCLIEGKGKDRIMVKNFKHVILSSNEDWPVHLDADDRRFFVLRVSEECKENHAYFGALEQQLENGGYEALLYDLLTEDLKDFNPRVIPPSPNAFDIKLRSQNSSYRYLYEVLTGGGFTISSDTDRPVWQPEIPKSSVYEDYLAWCPQNGEEKVSKELFGKTLKKLIPSTEDRRPGGSSRHRYYKLPPLKQAREEFCKAFKEEVPAHIFDDYSETED